MPCTAKIIRCNYRNKIMGEEIAHGLMANNPDARFNILSGLADICRVNEQIKSAQEQLPMIKSNSDNSLMIETTINVHHSLRSSRNCCQ